MNASKVFNLRRTKRHGVTLVVSVKSAWIPAPRDYHISRDISENGVFVVANKRPEIDADLKMEFSLPVRGLHLTRDGEIYYGMVEGKVVRLDDDGYAVRFENEFNFAIPKENPVIISH